MKPTNKLEAMASKITVCMTAAFLTCCLRRRDRVRASSRVRPRLKHSATIATPMVTSDADDEDEDDDDDE